MDDRHPKRRKDKYNPYTLSLVDGKCYLSFKDGQGFPHKLELDVKLYALFDRFELDDIYYADLTPVVGCEQGGRRPVLVIQNDVGNHHGSTVIVAAITSRRRRKRRLPTHIGLPRLPIGLRTASFAMLEQVRTIDRMRLGAYIGRLDGERMAAVDRAILISFGLDGLVGYDGKNAEK